MRELLGGIKKKAWTAKSLSEAAVTRKGKEGRSRSCFSHPKAKEKELKEERTIEREKKRRETRNKRAS